MKFSLKKDRTLMLAVKNKESLETEVIAIKGNYEIELFFSDGFCLEGVHHEKMDNNYAMKRAASEINGLKEEIRRLKNETRNSY